MGMCILVCVPSRQNLDRPPMLARNSIPVLASSCWVTLISTVSLTFSDIERAFRVIAGVHVGVEIPTDFGRWVFSNYRFR